MKGNNSLQYLFLKVEMAAGVVAEEESADPVQNPAVVALEEHRTPKRVRLSQTTQYRSTEHIFNTTNIVERLPTFLYIPGI
jgi:hypothetical protein